MSLPAAARPGTPSPVTRLILSRFQQARRLVAAAAIAGAAAVASVAPGTAAAESLSLAETAAILDNAFKTKFRTQAQLDAQVTKLFGPLSADKRAYARKAMAEMLSHEQLPYRIAKVAHPLLQSGMAYKDVMDAVFEAMVSLQLNGLRRLPDSTLARFFEFVGEHMAWLPPSSCKALMMGQASAATMAAWERQQVASLPLARFKEWHAIYREALAAELAEFPPPRYVSSAQAQSARQVLQARLKDRLSRTQASTAARIYRAAEDLASAPAEDACAFNLLVTQTILDMPDPYRGWQLTVSLLQVQ